jgi:hypothetical protein
MQKAGANVRICMAITPAGLTAYCNKEAFLLLANDLTRLAHSPEKEHYETHVRMRYEDADCVFEGKKPSNVWVLRTKSLAPLLAPHGNPEIQDFELTFMMMPEAELDDLTKCQETGLLPDGWNCSEEEDA